MGATGANINVTKFGTELQAVVQKIMSTQPQVFIATDFVGEHISC